MFHRLFYMMVSGTEAHTITSKQKGGFNRTPCLNSRDLPTQQPEDEIKALEPAKFPVSYIMTRSSLIKMPLHSVLEAPGASSNPERNDPINSLCYVPHNIMQIEK